LRPVEDADWANARAGGFQQGADAPRVSSAALDA